MPFFTEKVFSSAFNFLFYRYDCVRLHCNCYFAVLCRRKLIRNEIARFVKHGKSVQAVAVQLYLK